MLILSSFYKQNTVHVYSLFSSHFQKGISNRTQRSLTKPCKEDCEYCQIRVLKQKCQMLFQSSYHRRHKHGENGLLASHQEFFLEGLLFPPFFEFSTVTFSGYMQSIIFVKQACSLSFRNHVGFLDP